MTGKSGRGWTVIALCSHTKHASLELYDAGTKQPLIATHAEGADDVV
jgi:hypothetical protein